MHRSDNNFQKDNGFCLSSPTCSRPPTYPASTCFCPPDFWSLSRESFSVAFRLQACACVRPDISSTMELRIWRVPERATLAPSHHSKFVMDMTLTEVAQATISAHLVAFGAGSLALLRHVRYQARQGLYRIANQAFSATRSPRFRQGVRDAFALCDSGVLTATNGVARLRPSAWPSVLMRTRYTAVIFSPHRPQLPCEYRAHGHCPMNGVAVFRSPTAC